MGIKIREWVVFNKLEDFNSLLKYTGDDFTPIGNLCYINENGKLQLCKNFTTSDGIFNISLMKMNIRYDDEWTNPISESNWTYQTNKTFMKYVIFTLQKMTPEQLKLNPLTVHPNQKLDTEEGESNRYE